jgi:hypothetical protein
VSLKGKLDLHIENPAAADSSEAAHAVLQA